jgi:hypothetical protein
LWIHAHTQSYNIHNHLILLESCSFSFSNFSIDKSPTNAVAFPDSFIHAVRPEFSDERAASEDFSASCDFSCLHVSSGPSHQSGVVVARGRRRPLKRRVHHSPGERTRPRRPHPIPFSFNSFLHPGGHRSSPLGEGQTSSDHRPAGRGFYSSSAGKSPGRALRLHAPTDFPWPVGPRFAGIVYILVLSL